MFASAVRVLVVVGDTGPRKRNVLLSLTDEKTLDGMIKRGMLKKFGSKRGSTWGFGTLARLPRDERERLQGAIKEFGRG